MNDFFDGMSILLAASIACTIGFFLKGIYLKLKNRTWKSSIVVRSSRHYMEASCVSLSVGIASVACILIGSPWQEIVNNFAVEDYFYYSVIFLATFMLALFFRALAPVFLGLYVVYCAIFAALFIHSYSILPKDFSLSISQDDVVAINTVSLSNKNLLPMPRKWVADPLVVQEVGIVAQNERLFDYSISYYGETSVISKIITMISSLIIEKDVIVNTHYLDNSSESTQSMIRVKVYIDDLSIAVETF